MERSFKCVNSPNKFCLMCGLFSSPSDARPVTDIQLRMYRECFGFSVDLSLPWIPAIVCGMCRLKLYRWSKEKASMEFVQPMIWREPIDHSKDCYFCNANIIGATMKKRNAIKYPDVSAVTKPILRSSLHETPGPSGERMEMSSPSSAALSGSSSSGYKPSDDDQPKPFSQLELDDLVRDLGLSKNQSELLASRLQEKNLLQKGNAVLLLIAISNIFVLIKLNYTILGTKVTTVRERSKKYAECFRQIGKFCFCEEIPLLFERMKQPFSPKDWRLFIDGAKNSVKFVLLHNGNELPSIPVAYGVGIGEEYETIQTILTFIKYSLHKFQIVADFKVIAVLMGLQSGYTAHSCYLCLWHSRKDDEHYKRSTWPMRTTYVPGINNVKSKPLVPADVIILPPLHIKLGLFKNFVKALNKDGDAFNYLLHFFPRISNEKIRQGVFNGPQIRELLQDPNFVNHLSVPQKKAFESFRSIVDGFLGNNRSPRYKELVAKLLKNYQAIGARMSLKMHFLKNHLDRFPENLGDTSDEHGEKFHQDMMAIEKRFGGRFQPEMLGDYCWSLLRDTKQNHKKQGTYRHF